MEAEGLGALRYLAGMTQREMAEKLDITQPSVHGMETQTDILVSTLRRFVEAAGGTLEMRVLWPSGSLVNLVGIGGIL